MGKNRTTGQAGPRLEGQRNYPDGWSRTAGVLGIKEGKKWAWKEVVVRRLLRAEARRLQFSAGSRVRR